MAALSFYMYMLLATNLRQGIDGDIEVMLGICVKKMCVKRLLMFDPQNI